jgi:hypothetical protein
MRVGELAAGGGELVEVRRLRVLRAVAGEIAIADVVGEDKDDVGLGFFQTLPAQSGVEGDSSLRRFSNPWKTKRRPKRAQARQPQHRLPQKFAATQHALRFHRLCSFVLQSRRNRSRSAQALSTAFSAPVTPHPPPACRAAAWIRFHHQGTRAPC